MSKQHDVFISVHDQDLILQLEQNNIFRYLKDYKYLFLGDRPTDKLDNLKDKVIVARELDDNIEHQKSLFDYTGWYALVKNNLIKNNYVAIIHYDCLLFKDFEKSLLKKYKSNLCFISFLPCTIEKAVYFSPVFSSALVKAVNRVYNIDAYELIDKALKKGYKNWATGGSFACSKEWLERYIEWMEKIKHIILEDSMPSHNIERSSKIFNMANNIKEIYLPNKLQHIYNAAHNQIYQTDDVQNLQKKLFNKFISGELYKSNYDIKFSIMEKIKIFLYYMFS